MTDNRVMIYCIFKIDTKTDNHVTELYVNLLLERGGVAMWYSCAFTLDQMDASTSCLLVPV